MRAAWLNMQRQNAAQQRRIATAGRLSATVLSYPLAGSAATTETRLFDLYDRTDTTFKVRGHVDAKWAVIAGVHTAITAGVAGYGLDAEIDMSAIAGTVYVWVKIVRDETGGTATLELTDDREDGGDDWEPWDLWYVPWDAVNEVILWDDVVNLQGAPRWVAGA